MTIVAVFSGSPQQMTNWS